jgi:hypothetical protein
VLRPLGDADVVTLLGSRTLRAALAEASGGMAAVVVPMRRRGWTRIALVDPAFGPAAAAATSAADRGFPRPLLLTTDEVAVVPEGGRPQDVALRDPATPATWSRDVLTADTAAAGLREVTRSTTAVGTVEGVRVQQRDGGGAESSGALPSSPVVSIDVCRCGRSHEPGSPHEAPDWPLATAWSWLTAPVAAPDVPLEELELVDADDALEDEPDPDDLPWWDARSRPERRRAVLPLVLLGELQAGVLLRALWEVLQSPPGPGA